ncbi:Mediator of RNA polymerase II transcription subunit 31-like protein [Drosera capensis]
MRRERRECHIQVTNIFDSYWAKIRVSIRVDISKVADRFSPFSNPRFLVVAMSQSSIESGDGDSPSSSSTSLVNNNNNVYKDPDDGRQRFLLELEFVQCLANPTYIHYLAQNRYFEDEAFIGYLKYLQYWQRPEYVKFIMYPHCLYFLELLQNSSFRAAMAHPGNKELAHRQQFYFWKSYRNNRLKHIIPRALPEPGAPSPATSLPLIPLPSTNASAAGVPSPALSPMPYGIPPVASLPNNDPRNNVVDRRKRKKRRGRPERFTEEISRYEMTCHYLANWHARENEAPKWDKMESVRELFFLSMLNSLKSVPSSHL